MAAESLLVHRIRAYVGAITRLRCLDRTALSGLPVLTLYSTLEVKPMAKGFVKFVIGALITVVTAAKGQTLECGYVTLQLGESEREAVGQLNNAGFKNFAPVDESQMKTMQTFLGSSPGDICEVEFVKHKVAYAARHWTKNVRNELDAIHNVVEALHAIVPAPGTATCDIFNFYQSSPEYESKSVKISCGSHTVRIQAGKTNGKPTYDITEDIGTM
jgi:hypothetical protein